MAQQPRPPSTLPPPPPLPAKVTDPRWPVAVGSTLWFAAFCALLVARFAFNLGPVVEIWTCLAGCGLGVAGLAIWRWQRSAGRRGARAAQPTVGRQSPQ